MPTMPCAHPQERWLQCHALQPMPPSLLLGLHAAVAPLLALPVRKWRASRQRVDVGAHCNATATHPTHPPALPLGTPPPHHTPVLGLLPRSDRLHACPNMNACPSPALGLLHVPRMCSDAPHTHLAHQPTRTCRPHDSSQVTSVLYLVAGGHGWGPNPNPNPNPNPSPLPCRRWPWMGT